MSEENVVEKTEAQVQTEKEARLMGWVEKENYRDGDHWVDAETFVKRGKEINPILRKNNETLLKKLNERDAEIAEVKKVAEEFKKFTKEVADRKVAELQKELLNLREQKKEAVSRSDGDAVVAIDEAIDALKEQQAEAKKAPKEEIKEPAKPTVLDPQVVSWMDENKWFTQDEKYTRIADAIGISVSQNFPHLRGKDFFDKLDEELDDVLPQKYKKQSRTSPVEGSSTSTSRPTGSRTKETYEALPQEAKEACDRMVKQKLLTKEQYVTEYYAQG